jgi:hypothetical protein
LRVTVAIKVLLILGQESGGKHFRLLRRIGYGSSGRSFFVE